jgi:hypothetical protein
MAFVSELQALGDDRLHIVPQDERGLPDIGRARVGLAGVGTYVGIILWPTPVVL